MNLYVIAKYEKRFQVKDVIRQLREAGHNITHDWTDEDSTGLKGEARAAYLRRNAQQDMDGARSAEGVLVIHNDQLCGGLVELGIALGAARPGDGHPKLIVIVHTTGIDMVTRRQPIFYWLPNVYHFESLDGALRFINQAEKGEWE